SPGSALGAGRRQRGNEERAGGPAPPDGLPGPELPRGEQAPKFLGGNRADRLPVSPVVPTLREARGGHGRPPIPAADQPARPPPRGPPPWQGWRDESAQLSRGSGRGLWPRPTRPSPPAARTPPGATATSKPRPRNAGP